MSSRLLVRVFFLFCFSRNGIGEIIFVLRIINSLKPSRWWSSDKNLKLKSLFSLWFQVWDMWLLIWWPLEAYMVVNFRTRGINRDARKLVQTTILNLKKKNSPWIFTCALQGVKSQAISCPVLDISQHLQQIA
jgi:hypothetical protein